MGRCSDPRPVLLRPERRPAPASRTCRIGGCWRRFPHGAEVEIEVGEYRSLSGSTSVSRQSRCHDRASGESCEGSRLWRCGTSCHCLKRFQEDMKSIQRVHVTFMNRAEINDIVIGEETDVDPDGSYCQPPRSLPPRHGGHRRQRPSNSTGSARWRWSERSASKYHWPRGSHATAECANLCRAYE